MFGGNFFQLFLEAAAKLRDLALTNEVMAKAKKTKSSASTLGGDFEVSCYSEVASFKLLC